MTSSESSRDDLAFMKSVIEDRGPLPWWFGAHLLATGALFGLNLIVAGVALPPYSIWAWLPACLIYLPVWFVIHARTDYAAMGPSMRVFGAVWVAVVVMTLVVVASLFTAQFARGGTYSLIWPPIACSIYGGAWMVGALIRRSSWMGAVALGCFATAMVCAAMIGRPPMVFALGIGLLAFLGGPGFVLTRLSRRND